MKAKLLLITDNGLVPINMSFCEIGTGANIWAIVISSQVEQGSPMESDALRFISSLERLLGSKGVEKSGYSRDVAGADRTDQLRIFLQPA